MDRDTINRRQKQFIAPAISNYFSERLASVTTAPLTTA